MLEYVKVHGAGNDFVLLPDPEDRLALDADLARALCDRHRGIGGDGVIRVAPGRPGTGADVFMDYRNADGSVSEMCGNGIRCVAKHVVDRGLVAGPEVLVDTRSGVKPVFCSAGPDGRVTRVRVEMGQPVPSEVDRPLTVEGVGTVRVTTLSMGNPHAVLVVPDVASAPVGTVGPRLEVHAAFRPQGTNVEFIAVPDRDRVEGRIWERGVGETLASGSGASAMLAAAHLLGLAGRAATVALPGGDLDLEWTSAGMVVTGPAVEVASGRLDQAWLSAVQAGTVRGGPATRGGAATQAGAAGGSAAEAAPAPGPRPAVRA